MASNNFHDSNPTHSFNVPDSKITRPDWANTESDNCGLRSLLPYLLEPDKFRERILRVTQDTVLIRDKYPKASVHLLLLPRWTPHRDYHPHDAFEDSAFLSMIRKEAGAGLQIATQLLRSCMQKSLQSTQQSAKSIERMLDERDFNKDFHVGVHAHPSQHELHVHIVSRDMLSKHKYSPRHYQSFNTHFLVPLTDYPLRSDDIRRKVQFQNSNLLKEDFQCWKCGKDFGLSYEALQKHLSKEWFKWVEEGSVSIIRKADLPSLSETTIQDTTDAAAALKI